MKILFNNKFLDHNVESEAEGAYRINEFAGLEDTHIDGEHWISLVHPAEYIKKIKTACYKHDVIAEVQLTPSSFDAACLAVGLSVTAADHGDFAVVRPPGHHAGFESPAGFCLFNNIAIAAQKLVNDGKKVFILDIDGHHGNGTQDIFYSSDKVMFCSIHQEYAYPFSGFPAETGEGAGVGYTINFPLMKGKGDAAFLASINKAIDAAHRFKPDVIGVSAGFDGYEKDKLLQLNYSQHAFYECAYRIKKAFRKKKVFAVLEGGYHNDIRKLVELFIEGIGNGGKPPRVKYNEDMAIG